MARFAPAATMVTEPEPSRNGRRGRVVRWPLSFSTVELALLAVLVPIFWFPLRMPILTLAVLPVLPMLWLIRVRTRRQLRPSGLEPPLVYVLLATCLASLPVFQPDLAVPKILGMALGAVTLVTVQNAVLSRAALDRAIMALAIVILGLAGFGLVGVEWPANKLAFVDRLVGSFPVAIRGFVPNSPQGGVNPNELAGMLTLLLPLLIARVMSAGRAEFWRPSTLVLAVAALAGGVVLVATQSRGALLAVGFALALMVGLLWWSAPGAQRRSRLVRMLVPLFSVGCFGALLWSALAALRNWAATNGQTATTLVSFPGRIDVWQQSILMARDFAVTGIGLGQFDPVLHALYATPLLTRDEFVPHAHNLYLAYAVELGVPGAIAFAALVVAFFRTCVRVRRSGDGVVAVSAVGLAIGVLAFMIFGFTDAIAPGARGGLILWIVLGLAGALGRL